VASARHRTEAQAVSTLEAQGLTVSTTTGPLRRGGNGDAVSENPVAGTSVQVGSNVLVDICITTE
jgi:beta-lactam-binding protein with PASTA domain